MSSEEDVLFQVNHVKYKKDEGTLYMMSARLAWIQENRDTVSLSHHYSDIKSQKISPEGKPKIQLQVVLNDNSTFTFQFVHPDGPQTQIHLRNQIKEHLLLLLPKFKRKLNPELEEKNKLLSENPGLMQLYRDLVMTDIVTSEEFWKNNAPKFITSKPETETQQEVGISSGFLTGIQPTIDGTNGIVYNLTTELMESIFRTYPAVRKKHKECVTPDRMSESEFWAKFFQSHYFHRDRLPVSKDVFYSCSKADDKEMKKEVDGLRQTHKEIIALIDETIREEPRFNNMTVMDDKLNDSPAVTAHRNMIKRFNQHSIMLLKASERSYATAVNGNHPPIELEPPKKKRKKDRIDEVVLQPEPEILDPEIMEANALKLKEKIELEDLKSATNPNYQQLKLSKIDRYLNGPVPVYNSTPVSLEDVTRTIHGMREASLRWNTKPYLLDAKMAATIIGDLSPGGAIMKTNAPDNASQVVPTEVETELRNTYVSLNELLRHFWSCFPVTTPAAMERVKRCHETLKKFEQVKLQQVKERVLRDHLPVTLLSHLNSVIAAADMKYSRWLSTVNRPRR